MIFDAVPFSEIVTSLKSDFKARSIKSFVQFIEKRLGVRVMYMTNQVPFGRTDLITPFALAEKLQSEGVLMSFAPTVSFPDEPPLKLWGAICGNAARNSIGGGSPTNDTDALYAVLAETLERYLWYEMTDYYKYPRTLSTREIAKHGSFIAPERFAGFSKSQREHDQSLRFDENTPFLWIQGQSLTSDAPINLPAQTVSAAGRVLNPRPLIRLAITTGLATWTTRSGARLNGVLEIIERDAYMIMWLNQLTLPRISLAKPRAQSDSLNTLLTTCTRYGLTVHAIQLITDAPTHVVCAVVEDRSDVSPRFSFGLNAHRSLAHAIEHAILEALRARIGCRRFFNSGKKWDKETLVQDVGHYERLYYWGDTEHASKLAFMIKGPQKEIEAAVWEQDTPEEHLARIVNWCRENNYECASVSLGDSKKNVTPWFVEMVVIPEMQPTYLFEKLRQTDGARLQSIPKQFGYTPRTTPFVDAPHPFA